MIQPCLAAVLKSPFVSFFVVSIKSECLCEGVHCGIELSLPVRGLPLRDEYHCGFNVGWRNRIDSLVGLASRQWREGNRGQEKCESNFHYSERASDAWHEDVLHVGSMGWGVGVADHPGPGQWEYRTRGVNAQGIQQTSL